MTLIVALPTAIGLIIAADSRLTVFNGYCDRAFKISEVSSRPRTATFVTGYSTVSELTPRLTNHPCLHLSNLKFDAAALLLKTAERSEKLDEIIASVVEGTRQFVQANSDYEQRRGQFLFQAAVATYDLAKHRSRVDSFSINYNQDGSITADKIKSQEFGLDDGFGLMLFGEANYLTQAVFNGPGLQFLGERYFKFRKVVETVRTADGALAADFAVDLIEAASKTSSHFIRPETGIGGPVDVLLLGYSEQPQRLHWKNEIRP